MKTLFACVILLMILSWVNRWRVPARPTSSVPSRTKLGAEACPPRLRLFFAAVLLAVPAGSAAAEPVRLVAMGDFPYEEPNDFPRFERLIAAINQDPPALVLHVGDIKHGSSPCSDAAFLRIRDSFSTVEAPLLFTPGDNDWTDCHRPAAGAMDPLERLAALRRVFFAPGQTLGRRALPATRQTDATPALPYPENLRLMAGAVMVVTAHVVGSNNNLRQGHRDALAEFRARDAATAAWIRSGFAAARGSGARAVVLAMHADPFAQGNGLPLASNRSGFAGTLAALADGAALFDGPVLVIHGDGHRYTLDRPFLDARARPLANVTRLEVFGYPTVAAVEVTVTPGADAPFRFRTLAAPEPVSADQR